MRLPAGHAKRLFLGFTCSITFLIVLALLIVVQYGGRIIQLYKIVR